MGLFGSIFKGLKKVVGGVAKAGLSHVTGGISDSVISKLKSRNDAKKLARLGEQSAKARTIQTEAMLNKYGKLRAPRMPERFAGQSFEETALKIAQRKSAQAEQAMLERDVRELITATEGGTTTAKKKRAPRVEAARMLDFRAMSRAWVAANKPVSWQQWIKDFPQYTTARKITRVVN